jgi:hypothetical protein
VRDGAGSASASVGQRRQRLRDVAVGGCATSRSAAARRRGRRLRDVAVGANAGNSWVASWSAPQ